MPTLNLMAVCITLWMTSKSLCHVARSATECLWLSGDKDRGRIPPYVKICETWQVFKTETFESYQN